MKKFVVFIFLLAFLLLNFLSASRESLTYDEPVHLEAGIEEWQIKTFSLDTNNPPLIREIAALPIVFGLTVGNRYLLPRMMVTLLGLLLGLAIFWYTKEKFGFWLATVALFLFVFEPNFLAHSHYVTLDVGVTLFFFLGFIFGERFFQKPTWRNAIIFGIFSGLAFAAKITIIPTFLLSFLIFGFLKRKNLPSGWWKKIFLSGIVCLVVVWVTYFFTWAPIVAEREDPTRLSERIIRFANQKNLPFLKEIIFWLKSRPVPLGYFLATVKNGLVYNLFPNKGINEKEGFLPIILFLKIPLAFWVLFLIALFGQISLIKKEIILLVPPSLMILIFSLGRIMPRVRYLLPIFPFLIIIASWGARFLLKKNFGKEILIFLLIWYFLSSISYLPHFISYANEVVNFLRSKTPILVDSNYDWGQSLPDLVAYVKEKNIGQLKLSYFGTDNPENYGLVSDRPFGEKFEERCPLYLIKLKEEGKMITAISLTNWFYCGWWKNEEFKKEKIKETVGGVFLIFEE